MTTTEVDAGSNSTAQGNTTTAKTGAGSNSTAKGNTTTAETGAGSNSTAPATPKAGRNPVRRQESNKDKYGNEKPPQGAVIMTMKMIDDMADAINWGGQAAITQMMNEYLKAQTSNGLQSDTNDGTKTASAKNDGTKTESAKNDGTKAASAKNDGTKTESAKNDGTKAASAKNDV
ncbi:hypothetical protein BDU57DRAFT_12919 [Ampelomyces quisqualis]|uniref:Uncharacterized protein n=1 Tax=Ampelomyces quisqualis TaxID=50730 RepID=A0A6A5R0M0_AMPQU|nr:hypothetical protein BDU57DRAFT_12919 [Ampelomyces quisqualis]